MQQIILNLIFLKQVFTFITYDTGLAYNFDYVTHPSFYCEGGFSKTDTISFSNTFENIPYVFLKYDQIDISLSELEYKLQITSITTSSFTMSISCSSRRVYALQFRWFALDDKRIEVINNFNMNNPDDKTFQKKNPNALYGFVTITSIHYIGPIDFELSIAQIQPNSVTVGITKVAGKFTNLKQIGYQVIVGVQEAFIILGLQTVTGAFNSGALPIQPNRWFAIAVQGFKYSNNDNIRLRVVQSNTATTISYTWGTWVGQETPNSHSQIWIAYQFNVSFQALEFFKIKTSRKYTRDSTNLPTFDLELVNTNQVYTTFGNYIYLVDRLITHLFINIKVKCQPGKKVVAQFNCNSQVNPLFQYNCSEKTNLVSFFPQFRQGVQQYHNLNISIQASSLEVKDLLFIQNFIQIWKFTNIRVFSFHKKYEGKQSPNQLRLLTYYFYFIAKVQIFQQLKVEKIQFYIVEIIIYNQKITEQTIAKIEILNQ